jgi:hypothetical protein
MDCFHYVLVDCFHYVFVFCLCVVGSIMSSILRAEIALHRFTTAAQGAASDREERTPIVAPPPSTYSFPHGRWTLTRFPSLPARLAAYLEQQDEASLRAFSTASRVSPVRF